MNKFEEAIENARFSPDFMKQREIIANVLQQFANSKDCQYFKSYRTSGDKDFIYTVFFKIYGNVYVWSDVYENGLLEGCQLDVLYSEKLAKVLYSNIENSSPFAPLALDLLKEGKFVEI